MENRVTWENILKNLGAQDVSQTSCSRTAGSGQRMVFQALRTGFCHNLLVWP